MSLNLSPNNEHNCPIKDALRKTDNISVLLNCTSLGDTKYIQLSWIICWKSRLSRIFKVPKWDSTIIFFFCGNKLLNWLLWKLEDFKFASCMTKILTWGRPSGLRIHWWLPTILKTSKIVYEVMLFDIYILKAYSIHYTYRENTNVKKISSDKINLTKTPSFLFRELRLITVLLLICDFYTNQNARFISLKPYVRFSIFNSVPFLLKFIFLFNKMYGLFDFKTS